MKFVLKGLRVGFSKSISNRLARGLGRKSKAPLVVECNLCHREFIARTRFHRFCVRCKQRDELFRFAEWMPVTGS